jgi:hypothetical protein
MKQKFFPAMSCNGRLQRRCQRHQDERLKMKDEKLKIKDER